MPNGGRDCLYGGRSDDAARFAGGLLAALFGCRPCDLAPPVRANAQLPLANRGTIEPDVSRLRCNPPGRRRRARQYRRLTAAECRALAFASSARGRPHRSSGQRFAASQDRSQSPDLSDASRTVRGFAADDRNRSVAGAPKITKLAAAGAVRPRGSGTDSCARIASAQKAIDQGLKDRGDVSAFRRQLLEVESQAAKLEAGIGALNASLAGRLGLDPADSTTIWPADPLRVSAEVLDADTAVATALQYRPDLNLLRALASSDPGDTKLANAVLTGINPLLGSRPSTHPLAILLALVKNDGNDEKLHRQLMGVLETRGARRKRRSAPRSRLFAVIARGYRESGRGANLVARVDELASARPPASKLRSNSSPPVSTS